jgi:hypothetical protein
MKVGIAVSTVITKETAELTQDPGPVPYSAILYL